MSRVTGNRLVVTFNGNEIPVDDMTISRSMDTYTTSVGLSSSSHTITNDYLNSTFCAGHVTDESLVEYNDGIVIAYCINCNARITLGRVPGGVNKLKLTGLLALLREQQHESVLETVLELEANLIDEIETLTDALRLVRAAKEQTCKQLLP